MELKYSFAELTDKGNVREQNEDSFENRELPNGHVFILCDGMGGAAEGKKASSIAVKSIIEYLEREQYENLQIALYKSLEFANEQIYATSQARHEYKGMGTTACVLLINGNEIHFAHVGDSRIYLQTDSKLKHLTKDHSFVNQLIAQGTLTPEEAKNHPNKNRILRAMGVNPKVEPTVSSQPLLLQHGDIVILCSDGLTDMVMDNEIEKILNTKNTIEEKVEILLQKALKNGGKDNVTVQGIEIKQSPHHFTTFIDKSFGIESSLEKTDKRANKRRFRKRYLVLGLLSLLVIAAIFVGGKELLEGKNLKERVKDTINNDIEKVIAPLSIPNNPNGLVNDNNEVAVEDQSENDDIEEPTINNETQHDEPSDKNDSPTEDKSKNKEEKEETNGNKNINVKETGNKPINKEETPDKSNQSPKTGPNVEERDKTPSEAYKKLGYFIIGEKNEPSKNIYSSAWQFKVMTDSEVELNSNFYQFNEVENSKKIPSGTPMFLTKEKRKKYFDSIAKKQ